jgi:hypothetical protein
MRITDRDSYDVIVAGAGCAGFCAAVQAGRLGLRTAVFDEYGAAGGTMTVMGSCSIDQFNNPHRPVGDRMVIGGIAWEFVRELERRGFAVIPDMDAEYRVHWQYGVKVNPIAAAQCMDDFLIAANVDIHYHQKIVAVETHEEDGRVTVDSVLVSDKSGLSRYKAKVFIDCTGDGDLCAWAGADYECADPLQPGTLRLYIDHLVQNPDALKTAERRWSEAIARDASLGKMATFADLTSLLSGDGDNQNHICNINATDSDSLTKAEILSRRYLKQLMDIIRDSGLQDPFIATAPAIGIRESRRIIGDTIMTEADYLNKRIYDDAVCYTYWFIDIHRAGQASHIVYLHDDKTPTISLGALCPTKLKNMFVAGRCVSADRACSSAIRVKASCMAMGQAASAAAMVYLCEGEAKTIHDICTKSVCRLLAREGAIVPDQRK